MTFGTKPATGRRCVVPGQEDVQADPAQAWRTSCLIMVRLVLSFAPASAAAATGRCAQPADDPPAPDHHANGGFANPYVPVLEGGVIRYWLNRLWGAEAWARYDPDTYQVPRATPRLMSEGGSGRARVTWLGQATVLIQHRGVNILTDPIFSAFAGPVQLFGAARISRPGLEPDRLPVTHIVVLSHDHYDHLDLPSLRMLGDRPIYVVPLGLREWLDSNGLANDGRIFEFDWWETNHFDVGDTTVRITATPAQHVSGRTGFDRNRRLWASWAIRFAGLNVFFAGDTGYNPVQFMEIGRRLGPFDVALLPIGSYSPRSHMRAVHVDPTEAVRIHTEVRARRSFAIHWGTFFLSAEHPSAPPAALDRAARAASLTPGEFRVLAIGETAEVPIQP